ncbi:hypothetical protein TVAG_330640 [Trichomonas vaginalis G3]|uniref:Transmembrane protein n=1 Tax=Trichomonas vaginalis (strain ATCC PRA-98 / G3) TaxID=412133 RepID=A2F4N0_TRIV3|nr:hypothetical protein TVAGG3_0583510 [Trichomonas vaginalis G3]EAY00135.1 hypothetical protein TVAG_330640 [Trichomonas vaginalis G3]KAI5522737.1 hypothetical protein TVAGG3_0583510 [Trichomonas vaginalis G3]|eukprot:XP_001313064.1 hypothetical protein [Trichomonas vaginalis G3]
MNSRLNPYQDDPCSNPYADEYAPPQAVSTTQQYPEQQNISNDNSVPKADSSNYEYPNNSIYEMANPPQLPPTYAQQGSFRNTGYHRQIDIDEQQNQEEDPDDVNPDDLPVPNARVCILLTCFCIPIIGLIICLYSHGTWHPVFAKACKTYTLYGFVIWGGIIILSQFYNFHL